MKQHSGGRRRLAGGASCSSGSRANTNASCFQNDNSSSALDNEDLQWKLRRGRNKQLKLNGAQQAAVVDLRSKLRAQRKCAMKAASRGRFKLICKPSDSSLKGTANREQQMLLASSSAQTAETATNPIAVAQTPRAMRLRRRARLVGQGPLASLLARKSDNINQMDLIKSVSRSHSWHWNEADKSQECIVDEDRFEICFHPECSESAAAIRGSEPLIRDGNYYYWEITVFDKAYGTSVMFGLCTKNQSLDANEYCNLIGLDKNGWSLSHKGLIWHDGENRQYTQMFPANQSITIGLLFNTMRGELSYFMDGKNMGVAFSGLNNVKSELYPVVGSTAKCTRMRLIGTYCGYVSLLERSCFTLLKHSVSRHKLLEYLHSNQVPKSLIEYIAQVGEVCDSQTENTAQLNQYHWKVNSVTK